MKNKFLLLLALLPMMAQAQITKVTEEQKQQALQHVTEFCNLLTQWGNGQRTLDTKIYALCSGNDCSAYDDVSTNKETTLRNYLLGIQKKYPKSLSIHLSQPSISNCEITYEPELTMSSQVGSVNGNMDPYAFADITTLQTASYKNAYMAFKISHTISGHSNNATRLIIYDLNAKKITAYISGQGTFVSFLEGLNLMTNGNYKNAIQKFEVAMANQRSSLYKACNLFACMCSAYLLDYQTMIRYGKSSGDAIMSKYCDMMDYLIKENYTACLLAITECEQLISQSGGAGNGFLSTLYSEKGIIYSLPNDIGHNYNVEKSVDNFRKAIKLGNVQSAYMLFDAWLRDDNYDNYLSDREPLKVLEWAAEKGHLGAILQMGKLAEVEDPNDKITPIKWFTKGANLGDPFCMACLGRILISTGEKTKGCSWLKKALEGNKLETQIEAYSHLINDKWWPKSRSDVQSLLDSNSTPTTNTSSSTSSTSSSTSTSSATSSTYNYSTPSYHYKKYHGPFNKAKDEYIGGFSMGYIQKQWVVDYDNGETEKMGMFDDDKYLKGIQVGFRIDPQFGAGFGMNTGLFYEYCWAKSEEEHDSYGAYHYTYEEHGLYLPLHLKFTMNFSKWFQLSFYGGCAINYGISGIMYLRGDDTTYDSIGVFSEDDWRRWNFMFEYGASIRILDLQFDFSMARGLNDWSDTEGYKIKQGRPMNISMSICF